MVFALCFLFILVMTHALATLPFSGPEYYGHKFLKYGKRRHAFEKVSKPVFVYPGTYPVHFQNKMIPKVPKKGFSFGYPLLDPSHVSTYWVPSTSTAPIIDGTSLKGTSFVNSIPEANHQFDTSPTKGEPYSFFKSSNLPFPSVKKEPVLKDPKNFKRIPKIFEISFAKTKPKILFVKGTSSPFVEQKEFKPREVGFRDQVQPKPKSNTNIILIQTGIDNPPTKDGKPINEIDYFDVVSVPLDPISNVNDIPGNPVEINKPNNGDNLILDIPIENGVNTKITDVPTPDVNRVLDASPTDIHLEGPGGKINQDLTIVPITLPNNVGTPVENLNTDTIVTVGDIPGFIVDGGSSVDARLDPIFVTNEVPRNEQIIDVFNVNDVLISGPANTGLIDVLNVNDVLISGPANTGLIATDMGFPPSSFGVNDVAFSDIAIPGGPDIANIGVHGEFVAGGKTVNNEVSGNVLAGIQSNQNGMEHFATSVTQPIESRIGDINLANEISGGNSDINTHVAASSSVKPQIESSSVEEEDTNNPGVGSVVIVRPVSILLNAEPFGPGPYGQCRAPARVICGVRYGWEQVTGMTEWCQSNCVVFMYSSYCDDDRCQCKCI